MTKFTFSRTPGHTDGHGSEDDVRAFVMLVGKRTLGDNIVPTGEL